jgi:circadian clock protein KaiB
MSNLEAIFREHLSESHELEIVDILQDPARALADGIFLTPTLVKLAPAPVRRVVGSLSQREMLLNTLGFSPSPK